MAFVDSHRLLVVILPVSVRHPCAVRPLELRDIIGLGRITGTHLGIIRKRIRLVQLLALRRTDQILIHLALAHSRQEQCVNTDGPNLRHHVQVFVPVIESTDHIDTGRIGSPHRKKHTLHAILHGRMRSQFLIDIIMCALSEYILVRFRDEYLIFLRLLYLLFDFLFSSLFDCFARFFPCHTCSPPLHFSYDL